MSVAAETSAAAEAEGTSVLADAAAAAAAGAKGDEKVVEKGAEGADKKPDAKVDDKVVAKPDAAAEAKATADKAAAEKADAEKLDKAVAALALKLPEGIDAKDATVSEFKKLAAKAGLDTEKAQSLYDLHSKALGAAQKSFVDATQAEITTTRKDWVASVKADKEYGGAKFAETQASLKKVMAKYAPDADTIEFLNSGPGDHPGLVKLFARIGRDLAEDSVARTAASGAGAGGVKKSPEAIQREAYPNSPELFAKS